MSLRRKIFYGFTATVIALLLILPMTGWLARLQLIPFFCGGTASMQYLFASTTHDADAFDHAVRPIVERNPNDFDLQYAYAVQSSDKAKLRLLDALAQRFPDDPRVIALRLRVWTGGVGQDGIVKIDRPADEQFFHPSDKPNQKAASSTPYAPDPVILAQFDSLASTGERLEPNNAYFPAMRAVGLFAAHRDTEAILAWKRAGNEPVWDEHTSDEMRARERLMRALHGGNEEGAFARMSTWATILFPHYASLRATARMANVMAIRAELAGNAEEGFQIRRATRSIGERMQFQSTSYIGNLVGIAIASISSGRPGGVPAIEIDKRGSDTSDSSEKRDERNRPRWDAYTSYLNRIGHPEEAEAFTAVHAQGLRLKDIGAAGMPKSAVAFGEGTYRLIACWGGDILLITGTLFALAFGGVFALVYRFSPRIQKSEPLQSSAWWGLMLAVELPALGVLWVLAINSVSIVACALGAALVIAASIAWPIWMRLSIRQLGHGVLVMVATLVSVVAVFSTGLLATSLFAGSVGTLSMLQSLSGNGGDSAGNVTNSPSISLILPFVVGVIMMFLPLMMLLTFIVFSRILRIPVAAGVTRGMRALSLPLACVLLLGWSVCMLATLRQENKALAEMDRVQRYGELQTYAHLAGQDSVFNEAVPAK